VSFAESDWLDRASGPGPFKGFYLHYRFLCLPKTTDNQLTFKWLTPWDRTASALNAPVTAVRLARGATLQTESKTADDACKSDTGVRGYFELTYRRAVSLENDVVANHSQVHLVSYEVAYVERFSRAFDFSLGTGLNYIDPRRRGWDGELDTSGEPDAFTPFRRISVTPSVIYSPLASGGEGPRAHLIRVQAGVTIFLRGFHAQDFCNTGVTRCLDPSWSTHGADVVPMVRAIFDGSLLWKGW
jgi:hypothetical protein